MESTASNPKQVGAIDGSEWFVRGDSRGYEYTILDDAFNEAKARICGASGLHGEIEVLLNRSNSVKSVYETLEECISQYQKQHKESKALKWLRRLSEKMLFYERVVDTVIQVHPETGSLIWGIVKMLLLCIGNHEKTVKGLAKALSTIGDELPRVNLLAGLYPTQRMKRAVTDLIVNILDFVTRAHVWYAEGKVKRALHGFTRPFDLQYGDILDKVTRAAREVRDLAACGLVVEFRELQKTLISDLRDVKKSLSTEFAEAQASRSLVLSAAVDTNARVTDLQFSQVSQQLSKHINIWDPDKVVEYLRANRRRSSQNQVRLLAKTFWEVPRMRNWTRSKTSDISIVKGPFKARQALRYFCVDVIEQLQLNKIPVIWALGTSQKGAAAHSMTNTQVLKYIIQQLLKLCRITQTEKSLSLSTAAFFSDLSYKECFALVESFLLKLSGYIYLVIDLELLQRLDKDSDFDWLSSFKELFAKLNDPHAGSLPIVKVLLMAYSSQLPFPLSPAEASESLISTQRLVARAKNRKVQTIGPRSRKTRFATEV